MARRGGVALVLGLVAMAAGHILWDQGLARPGFGGRPGASATSATTVTASPTGSSCASPSSARTLPACERERCADLGGGAQLRWQLLAPEEDPGIVALSFGARRHARHRAGVRSGHYSRPAEHGARAVGEHTDRAGGRSPVAAQDELQAVADGRHLTHWSGGEREPGELDKVPNDDQTVITSFIFGWENGWRYVGPSPLTTTTGKRYEQAWLLIPRFPARQLAGKARARNLPARDTGEVPRHQAVRQWASASRPGAAPAEALGGKPRGARPGRCRRRQHHGQHRGGGAPAQHRAWSASPLSFLAGSISMAPGHRAAPLGVSREPADCRDLGARAVPEQLTTARSTPGDT